MEAYNIKISIVGEKIIITTDICYLAAGVLMGGVVGIGTIIATLLTGPFIQFCIPYGEKIVNSIINPVD